MCEHNINENEYFIIPNPIYDVVFRYLMDDPESAQIILSTLIDEKIVKLEMLPITHPQKKELKKGLKIEDPKTSDDIRLFHLDFTATIELHDGTEELLMIELQKANEPGDIFRFKRYISRNFQKKHKTEFVNPISRVVETIDKPIRLIAIFILNFRIENEINDLFIKTNHQKTGVFKEKQLEEKNEFIDHLTYDVWIVQLPNLRNISKEEYINNDYKKKLYKLLSLFDQKSQIVDNEHRLRLIRKFFPGYLDRVIKRLLAADIENPDLEKQMYAEDEYLQALLKRDNEIVFFRQKLDKTIERLDTTKLQLDTTKIQLDTTQTQLDTTKTQLDTTKTELDTTKNELDRKRDENKQLKIELAKTLKGAGIDIEIIIAKTNLSQDEIDKL